ncbi:MAG: ADP-ribosylglycohydrolase family protein, partial [Halieaceae bacterium]|nr:ADP-ribosylglycohydrolase family protein [Halieaceae bacterium]
SERWAESELAPAIATIANGSFKDRQPPEIRGTGYVVDSIEAALWAFWRTDSFRDGALAAANLGDDADTTAAIFGQLAGAHYGLKRLPADWVERVAFGDLIRQQAERLAELAAGRTTESGE